MIATKIQKKNSIVSHSYTGVRLWSHLKSRPVATIFTGGITQIFDACVYIMSM